MDEKRLFDFPPQSELDAKLMGLVITTEHGEHILPIFSALGSVQLVAMGIANHLNIALSNHLKHVEEQFGKRKAWVHRVVVVAHMKPFLIASIDDEDVATFIHEYLAMPQSLNP